MGTPSERLELRQQLQECRVCAWLSSLGDKERKEWAVALANPRFTHTAVATEIRIDQTAASYAGPEVGPSSVETHRRKLHQ
jgi:hypothetical protein